MSGGRMATPQIMSKIYLFKYRLRAKQITTPAQADQNVDFGDPFEMVFGGGG